MTECAGGLPMSFRKTLPLCAVVLLSGCGLLGSKDDPGNTLDFPSNYSGCLDHAGERLDRYLTGDISADEWAHSFDCTMESLRMLDRFSATGGNYTPANFQTLVSSLLITDTEVPADFMPAVFELKSALLGGTK